MDACSGGGLSITHQNALARDSLNEDFHAPKAAI
jgi:hypothetical protein